MMIEISSLVVHPQMAHLKLQLLEMKSFEIQYFLFDLAGRAMVFAFK